MAYTVLCYKIVIKADNRPFSIGRRSCWRIEVRGIRSILFRFFLESFFLQNAANIGSLMVLQVFGDVRTMNNDLI